MPFSAFDSETHKLLRNVFDGAMLVLEVTNPGAVAEDRRAETIAQINRQLAAAASEGERDFSALQLRALEGID